MISRTALPLLVLLAAGCAQVPYADGEPGFDERGGPATSLKRTAPVAAARAPAAMPVVAAPKLQVAEEIAPPSPQAAAPEAPSKSLWPRITRGFAMAPMENDLVREWEHWYASRPDYLARMIARSNHFLFHVVEQVEKRNMPMEIALLPMIESAYNPGAYSKAHASGMWQFVPATGKDFGLRQNWWYDGRRDVLSSTEAALDYLQKLYGMFGDWQLALASYNWGEGSVGRAMERNRQKGLPTDYESLTVPAETRGYIPKLIAIKNILSDPARFGLTIADIQNEPYFDTVTVKRHIDMKVAARLAEMSPEEFRFLNPGHNKLVIKAGEAERIVLPRHKVETFLTNLQNNNKPLLSWMAVRLRPGEKAERVAADHGMTLTELKELNGLQNQKKLVVGQPLLVPLKEGADGQLLDMPVMPVTLPKAIQAAKNAAEAKRAANVTRRGGAKVVIVQKVAVRGRVHPAAQQPRQLRAETGRHVKVVAAKPAARKAQAQKVKVASR
jgi:membrane-bound lytic murein transglycosylase D